MLKIDFFFKKKKKNFYTCDVVQKYYSNNQAYALSWKLKIFADFIYGRLVCGGSLCWRIIEFWGYWSGKASGTFDKVTIESLT